MPNKTTKKNKSNKNGTKKNKGPSQKEIFAAAKAKKEANAAAAEAAKAAAAAPKKPLLSNENQKRINAAVRHFKGEKGVHLGKLNRKENAGHVAAMNRLASGR
jgi:hypothetical protein